MNDATLVTCADCHQHNRVPDARRADDPVCGRCGQPLLPGEPIELTDTDFDAVAERGGVAALVDF
mgnify:FL=1